MFVPLFTLFPHVLKSDNRYDDKRKTAETPYGGCQQTNLTLLQHYYETSKIKGGFEVKDKYFITGSNLDEWR